MAKPKVPFRKHALKKIVRTAFTPVADKPEGLTAAQKGYWPGSSYSEAEKEFMTAVVRWQRKHRSKFLSHTAYLRIALELGYRRDIPTPSPPSPTPAPTAPMNAFSILDRMTAAGFTFARGADGAVSFHAPPDVDCPERQHLLALVAWSWGWLAEHAAKYVSPMEGRE